MQFTKEQLIAHIRSEIEDMQVERLSLRTDNYADLQIASLEIALATLTAKPFMYGIADPAGGPHFAEFCVSGNLHHIEKEVETLNDIDEIDVNSEPHYRVAALYRLPEIN